jgi:hypothetical protein
VGGWFWGMYPVEFYLSNRRLEEWMIYRLLLSGFLFTCSFIFMSAGVLAEHMLSLVYQRKRARFWSSLASILFSSRQLVVAAILAFVAAALLVWPGIVEYVRTAHVTLHWSRPLAAVFLLQLGLLALIHAVMQTVIGLWKGQLESSTTPHRR